MQEILVQSALDLIMAWIAKPVPTWSVAISIVLFWLVLRRLRSFVRLWALLTLPATFLHECAHLLVGLLVRAQPSRFSLWPQRVQGGAWRLGYVAFTGLRWWNGGLVALAPLLWVWMLMVLGLRVQHLPKVLPAWQCMALAIAALWLWIAVAPSRTDWQLARQYWFSAALFLLAWGTGLYALLKP